MAIFTDVGMNKILYRNQLRMNAQRIADLNSLFPQAAFNGQVLIAPHTQDLRMSSGIEFQVLLPIVQAPFRVYYAVNPLRVYDNIQTPVVADRSYFPNAASYGSAISQYGVNYPFHEKRGTFRFTIGRTF